MHAPARSLTWLAVAAGLLAAWAVALPAQPRQLPDGVLTLSQKHRVAAEDYLLSAQAPTAVLVGSSMSDVLPTLTLRPVYSLALAGGSALTGLRLIEHAPQVPAVIFIEVNVLERPADETLLAETTQPLALWIKAHCEACRTRNQPLTVVLSALSRWRLKPLTEEELDRAAEAAPQGLHPRGFAIQQANANDPVAAQALASRMAELESAAQVLTRRGARLVFVELPVHPAIAAGRHQLDVVEAARRAFPPDRYKWLTFRDREYATRDGVHLTYVDGRSVAQAIAAAANEELRP